LDRPFIAPQTHDVAKAALNWAVSPGGKRAVVEARGDIWTLPAENGAPRNLTATDDASERYPAWSPDGEWIAYVSDAGGEYELYLTRSDGAGRGEAARPRQLTDGHTAFFMGPTWAPDSKRLAFQDQTGRIYVHHLEPNRTDEVDRDPCTTTTVSWSHDGTWLAYTKTGDNLLRSVWLYDAVAGGIQPLTAGVFNDSWPCFDREGKYLFFASAREFSEPRYEDLGTTFVYSATDRLYAVPLRADVPSPFLPESDEELWGEAKAKAEKEAAAKGKDGDDKDKEGEDQPGDSAPEGAAKPEEAQGDAAKPADAKAEADKPKERLKIDTGGFERRAVMLPVERGNFTHLSLTDDHKLVYVRRKPNGAGQPGASRPGRQARGRAWPWGRLGRSPTARCCSSHGGAATLREGPARRPRSCCRVRCGTRSAGRVARDVRRRLAPLSRLVLRPEHARRGLGGDARPVRRHAGGLRLAQRRRLRDPRADLRAERRARLLQPLRVRGRPEPGRAGGPAGLRLRP
jgi:tricorn protease